MQRSKTYLPPAALQALLVMKRHLAQMNFLLFEKQSMKTELFHAPEYWCNGGAGGYRWGQPIWVSITASKWFSVGKKNGSCSPWGILKIKQIIQINPSDSQKLCSDSQKCYSGKMPTKEVSCSPDFVEVLVPWLTVFKNW